MDDLGEILEAAREGVAAANMAIREILIVVDGHQSGHLESVLELTKGDELVRVLRFEQRFGEGAALRAGLQEAEAPLLLMLPAYFQVSGDVIPKLLEKAAAGTDLAFASRKAQQDTLFNRIQRGIFNLGLRRGLGVRFRDMACGVRVLRRDALEELAVQGGFHRFMVVAAVMRGLSVKEVEADVHPRASRTRTYSPIVYLQRILDLANVVFLSRFVHRPLRFFGIVGGFIFTAGFLLCAWLSIERLFFAKGLAERPLFLLGILLLAFGFQIIAIGLLGEIITYGQSATRKPYVIKRIIRRKPGEKPRVEVPSAADQSSR